MYPSLNLKTNLKLSPQLVQTARFLQASASELEALLAEELAANPALAWSERTSRPDTSFNGWTQTRPGGECAEDWLANYPARTPVLDRLAGQIGLLASGSRRELAVSLLGHLDERGFLSAPAESLSNEMGVGLADIHAALVILHELEPPGIGAGDTRECLLIQCDHLQAEGVDCAVARRVLEEAWEDFLHGRWKQVARRVGGTLDDVEAVARFLRRNCCLHPLALLDDSAERPTGLPEPDLIMALRPDGEFDLQIPGEERFSLRVAPGFQPGSDEAGCLTPAERRWVRQHVDRAHLMIQSLQQRWDTLRRVGQHLIAVQRAYLQSGPSALVPLTRVEVARALGLSGSTVSRAVQGKVLQLPSRRLVPLSELFDASLPLKSCIRDILAQTHRPLCDREIVEHLQAHGHRVARRTVAKYRAQIGLPDRPRGF
jgi:RNA polymerase sigma-54 factor